MATLRTTAFSTKDLPENEDSISVHSKSKTCDHKDQWFYPEEMSNDLQGVDIPPEFIPEALTCGWEYARAVIPHFTNYPRFIAFCRLIVMSVVAEFKGSLVDEKGNDRVYGYDLEALLRTIFQGTVYDDEMCRDFRCFLHFATQKSNEARRSDHLFRQYADSLAYSPKTWFRFRDCDALLRFTFGAALACNNYDRIWFKENELQILCEIGVTMYDSVAFYKHRTEGEIHNTFAYIDESLRKECHRRSREVLWALDVAWANIESHRLILNLIRNFGGPLHMMIRRYRFVEENLTIGRPETEERVEQARQNLKLWYRLDPLEDQTKSSYGKTLPELDRQQSLFRGFRDIVRDSESDRCETCMYPQSYGTKNVGQFSSVQLCEKCLSKWETYVNSLSIRAAEVFPLLRFDNIHKAVESCVRENE